MKIKIILSVISIAISYCITAEAQEKTTEPDKSQILIQMLHDFDGLPHGHFSGNELKLPARMPKFFQTGDVVLDEGDSVMVMAGHVSDRLSQGYVLRVLKVFDTDKNSVGMIGVEGKEKSSVAFLIDASGRLLLGKDIATDVTLDEDLNVVAVTLKLRDENKNILGARSFTKKASSRERPN